MSRCERRGLRYASEKNKRNFAEISTVVVVENSTTVIRVNKRCARIRIVCNGRQYTEHHYTIIFPPFLFKPVSTLKSTIFILCLHTKHNQKHQLHTLSLQFKRLCSK